MTNIETLIAGHYYLNGRGDVYGPMDERAPGKFFDQYNTGYHANGLQWDHVVGSTGNLVAECAKPTALDKIHFDACISEFERWYLQNTPGFELERATHGYKDHAANISWEAWQASRKEAATEIERLDQGTINLTVQLNEARKEIESMTAELAAAKAKHYEECAELLAARSCDCAKAIRAALSEPHSPELQQQSINPDSRPKV